MATTSACKQVLYNLLSNAIKFTPTEGRIGINIAQKGGFVEISICDSGIGIPKAGHELVFEKFHQVGDTVKAGYKGTGLGLTITRALVEHHGGRIRLESNLGQGSCFIFTMPAGTLAAGQLSYESNPIPGG
jgi:two-component system, sensor histidine kinase ChiS